MEPNPRGPNTWRTVGTALATLVIVVLIFLGKICF